MAVEISVWHRQRTTAMLSARSPHRKRGRAGLSNRRIRRGRQPNPAIASPIRLNPYCRIECRVRDLAIGRRLHTHALIEYPGQASLTPAAQVARSQWAVATIAQTPTSAALVKSKKTIAALEPLPARASRPSFLEIAAYSV